MKFVRNNIGYNHMSVDQLRELMEDNDWDVQATLAACRTWSQIRAGDSATKLKSEGEKDGEGGVEGRRNRKRRWEAGGPSAGTRSELKLPRIDEGSANIPICLDLDCSPSQEEQELIVDSWASTNVVF